MAGGTGITAATTASAGSATSGEGGGEESGTFVEAAGGIDSEVVGEGSGAVASVEGAGSVLSEACSAGAIAVEGAVSICGSSFFGCIRSSADKRIVFSSVNKPSSSATSSGKE